jgi:hypothetical protein
MTNSPTSPTAAVLRALLAPNEGPKCNTIVYSYRDQFEDLWHAEPGKDPVAWACGSSNAGAGDGQSATSKERTLVLVWDGMPDSSTAGATPAQWQSANIRDRVTAYDWLVAFLLRLQQALEATEMRANLRVLVLDLASGNYPGSFACFAFPALAAQLSGIRVYTPGEAGDLLADLGMTTAAATPWKRLEPADVGGKAFRRGIEWLRRLWLDELTRAETRHDVANMLAPLLMAEELRDVEWPGAEALHDMLLGNDKHRQALAVLVRTLGGIVGTTDPASNATGQATQGQPVRTAPHTKPTAGPLQQAFVQNDVFGRFNGGVRFLMVDDQAECGYDDVVASILFGSEFYYDGDSRTHSAGAHALHWESTPSILVEALWSSVGLTRRDTQSVCGYCGGRGAKRTQPIDWLTPRLLTSAHGPDVLLLDLRLFSGAENGVHCETEHLQALLDFCHQSGLCQQLEQSRKHFAQRSVNRALRRAIESAKQRLADLSLASNAPARLDHLALLPLLLTLVDPSLPIVLFSSTRQRSILAALEERPNIISSFAKPILSGYAEGQSISDHTTSVADLIEAISQGLDLHERRVAWVEICTAADGKPEQVVSDIVTKCRTAWGVQSRPLRYTVGGRNIQDVARDFISTVYSGRYADALLVPSNWCESLGIDAQTPEYAPLAAWLPTRPPNLMPEKMRDKLDVAAATATRAADLTSGMAPYVRWTAYGLLDTLRNLSAHYAVTSADDADLREVVIFCFLWLTAGAINGPDKLLIPGTHADIANAISSLVRRNGRDGFLVPILQNARPNLEGVDSVLDVLWQLQTRIEDKVVSIVQERIRTALLKIVTAPVYVCLDGLPLASRESDIGTALEALGCEVTGVEIRSVGGTPCGYGYARLRSPAAARRFLSDGTVVVQGRAVRVCPVEPTATLVVRGNDYPTCACLAGIGELGGRIGRKQAQGRGDSRFRAEIHFDRGNDVSRAQQWICARGGRAEIRWA